MRILIIEDDPGDADLIREFLTGDSGAACALECADRLSSGLERLAKGGIDAVLLDLSLPDSRGLQTVTEVLRGAPSVPIVVMTGLDDESLAVETVRQGAQDYLVKGRVDGSLLWRILRYAMERKRTTDALQAANSRLAAQQQSLEIANKRLQEVSRMKDEFIANTSHELRTPLTAIKEGVSLMLDAALGSISDQQRDFLQSVDENVERLTELITNLLDLSKIEAGRLRLTRKRLSMRTLMQTTLESYQVIAGGRAIKAEVGAVPDVFADSNRVLQVFGNLFSNAVKFTQENGAITFGAREDDGYVAVSVQDDGIGMAKDDLPKLFQRFSQVGKREGRPMGTGLGLRLCKELVEMHRGTISVTSAPGKGSTFTFRLPIYTPELALEESFNDVLGSAERTDQEGVGLIAIDTEPLSKRLPMAGTEPKESPCEQVVDFVRNHLHRGDEVVEVGKRWVVALAVTDAPGVQAIVERIRSALKGWVRIGAGADVPFGTAFYPLDGDEVQGLFEKATASLTRGPVQAGRAASARDAQRERSK